MARKQAKPDLETVMWSFADLQERNICGSRYNLHCLIKFRGFPKPIKAAGAKRQGRALYPAREVMDWLERRAAERTAA